MQPKAWNESLSRIYVEGGKEEDKVEVLYRTVSCASGAWIGK